MSCAPQLVDAHKIELTTEQLDFIQMTNTGFDSAKLQLELPKMGAVPSAFSGMSCNEALMGHSA